MYRRNNIQKNFTGIKQIAVPLLSSTFLTTLILLSSFSPAFSIETKTLELGAVADTYVVNDLNDQLDRAGLRNLNTGDLEFMKIWYAWNVTDSGKEKIISLGYMKYDLSDIDARFVESAKLQMYANIANLTGAARPVDIYLANDNTWSEQALTYNTAPSFTAQANSTSSVTKADKYYSWDVTDLVKQKAGSELPMVIALKTMYENSEEQVIFYSKEAKVQDKRPKLMIEYAGPLPTDMLESKSSANASKSTEQNDMSMILYGLVAAASGAGGFAFFMYNKQRNGHSNGNQPVTTVISATATEIETGEKSFCFNCGKQTMPEYNVCPYCGTNLK